MYPTKKRGRLNFHESYYDHNCSIMEKRDILNMDIQGGFTRDRLKRWWHGLFLLSYTDERSRIFYKSSEAMRLERVRQYRKFRGRIHPLSRFRNFWDCLMLMLFLANKVIMNHNMSITYGQMSHYAYYVGAIIELFIIFDVYLNMQTGYIDHDARRIVLGKRDGLLHYGSTKLFLHVASAIPLQCIMFLRYGSNINCTLCKTNNFILTLKTISVFGLFRIYESSSYWTRERSSYKLTHFFRFMRISILGLMTMVEYINLTDFFVLMLMVAEGKIDDTSYISALLRAKYVIENPPSDYKFFIYHFARTGKSLHLYSFSLSRAQYHLDTLVSLFAYLLANFFTLWNVVECFNFLHRIGFGEDKMCDLKSAMRSLVRCRQLPDKVTKKMLKYYEFNHAKIRAIETHNSLVRVLPQTLKNEILLETRHQYIKRVTYFKEWPQHIVDEIVLMLKEDIYLSNDMVADPWVQSEGLLIVAIGELAVYNGETETGHLIDGDFFGELSLVTDKEMRTSCVVAITHCVTLLLDKSEFRRFMRQYPDLFFALKHHLKEKYDKKIVNSTKDT